MSYEKQNFKDGQVLTARNLNHMEDGIANASNGGSGGMDVFVVKVEHNIDFAIGLDEIICDATLQEIMDAYENGKMCICLYVTNFASPVGEKITNRTWYTDFDLKSDYDEVANVEVSYPMFASFRLKGGSYSTGGLVIKENEVEFVVDNEIPFGNIKILSSFYMTNEYNTKLFRVCLTDSGTFDIEEVGNPS